MINISHKISLDPTKAQEVYFRRAAGTARFAWNWALAQWQERYKAGEQPSHFKIHKHLTSIKKDEFPWMYEVSKTVPQYAIYDSLNGAFQRFFKKQAKYPRFKSKHRSKDTFSVDPRSCGACHDRDLNAAVNLENLALNSRVTACGEDVSPGSPSALGRPSVKQETLILEEK